MQNFWQTTLWLNINHYNYAKSTSQFLEQAGITDKERKEEEKKYIGTSVFKFNSFLRVVHKLKSLKTKTIFPIGINVK